MYTFQFRPAFTSGYRKLFSQFFTFSQNMNIILLWPWTLTHDLDLGRVKVNHYAKHLGRLTLFESYCLNTYTYARDRPTALLEMWANAQRDGRPAEYRWRPLFNAAVWLTPTTRVPCSNAAKTRNPLKLPGVPQTNKRISAASGPKFTILWGHVGEILLLNKFFSDCRYMP